MVISYDTLTGAFLAKINEFDLLELSSENREAVVEGFIRRAVSYFKKNCKYDFTTSFDDTHREFTIDIADADYDELVEILSEGMIVQWLKPYVYKQENLENALSTRDFSVYSPAELLLRVGNQYKKAQDDFTQLIREYSFNHNDLTRLHT